MHFPAVTARQLEVLRFIAQHMRDHQRPPTRRELSEMLGVTAGQAIADHLHALERKRLLVYGENQPPYRARARAIRFTRAGLDLLGIECPYCGASHG